jgi:hypothetical protein
VAAATRRGVGTGCQQLDKESRELSAKCHVSADRARLRRRRNPIDAAPAAEACRADFNNPLSQFVYRYTNPVLAPIRRVLPNWRRINLAALLLAWLVMLLKRLVLFALRASCRMPACWCWRWPSCSTSCCCSTSC